MDMTPPSTDLDESTGLHGPDGGPSLGDFDQMKTAIPSLEKRAWKHVAACYAHQEVVGLFDEPLVNTATVHQVVHDVCQAYQCLKLAHGVLLALYLENRKRNLTFEQDYYVSPEGGISFCAPGGDEEEGYTRFTGYGYFGRTGAVGDIVDFDRIDPDEIDFHWGCPVDDLWEQLELDHQMPLGLLNYDIALEQARGAIRRTIEQCAGPMTANWALQDLRRWVLDMDLQPDNMLPGIAVAAHVAVLRALSERRSWAIAQFAR